MHFCSWLLCDYNIGNKFFRNLTNSSRSYFCSFNSSLGNLLTHYIFYYNNCGSQYQLYIDDELHSNRVRYSHFTESSIYWNVWTVWYYCCCCSCYYSGISTPIVLVAADIITIVVTNNTIVNIITNNVNFKVFLSIDYMH